MVAYKLRPAYLIELEKGKRILGSSLWSCVSVYVNGKRARIEVIGAQTQTITVRSFRTTLPWYIFLFLVQRLEELL